ALTSNDLMQQILWPANGQTNTENYTYNALAEVLTQQDRNQTTHSYTRDVLGRQTRDVATVTSATVDTTVLRLDTAYDTDGRAAQFTSYGDTAGTVLRNQVTRTFNGLSQLVSETQFHGGTATGTVQYVYSEMAGGANHSRLQRILYPNG